LKDAAQAGRRRFLRSGIGLAVAGLGCGPAAADTARTLTARVRDSFADPAAAVAVGRSYLASRNGEVGVRRLAAELEAVEAQWRPVLKDGHAGHIRRFAIDQCRCDFVQDRLTTVDGWLLGFTEVRLCALAALA
jgi:hypothetical protein